MVQHFRLLGFHDVGFGRKERVPDQVAAFYVSALIPAALQAGLLSSSLVSSQKLGFLFDRSLELDRLFLSLLLLELSLDLAIKLEVADPLPLLLVLVLGRRVDVEIGEEADEVGVLVLILCLFPDFLLSGEVERFSCFLLIAVLEGRLDGSVSDVVVVVFSSALAGIFLLHVEALEADVLGAFDLAHQDVAPQHLFALATELAEDTSLE